MWKDCERRSFSLAEVAHPTVQSVNGSDKQIPREVAQAG